MAEWYNNYYWLIYAGYDGNIDYIRIFIADREFSIYNADNLYYVSGNINCWQFNTSNSWGSQNINFYRNNINVNEPTLSNRTNPSLISTTYASKFPKFSNFDVKLTETEPTYFFPCY